MELIVKYTVLVISLIMFVMAGHVAGAAPVFKEAQPAGVVIAADMLEMRDLGGRNPASVITETADLVGLETKHRIAAGAFIKPSSVQQPRDVKRGDVITLTYKKPGIALMTDGRALADGYVGDWIEVMNLGSRTKVQGKVLASGRVEVH